MDPHFLPDGALFFSFSERVLGCCGIDSFCFRFGSFGADRAIARRIVYAGGVGEFGGVAESGNGRAGGRGSAAGASFAAAADRSRNLAGSESVCKYWPRI